MIEKISNKVLLKMDDEYIKITKEILSHPEFIKRKQYVHHENRSVYAHCLVVSVYSYNIAKKIGLNYKEVAISGLLHDFYYNDWQLSKEKRAFFKLHGFVHAKEALENAKLCFPTMINKKVENAIKRHMFPLNVVPPLYFESWLICVIDKYCSCEIFLYPHKLYKYIGITERR